MRIDIVNVKVLLPRCKICDKQEDQMLKINLTPDFPHICFNCSKMIATTMNDYWDKLGFSNDPHMQSRF